MRRASPAGTMDETGQQKAVRSRAHPTDVVTGGHGPKEASRGEQKENSMAANDATHRRRRGGRSRRVMVTSVATGGPEGNLTGNAAGGGQRSGADRPGGDPPFGRAGQERGDVLLAGESNNQADDEVRRRDGRGGARHGRRGSREGA